MKGPDAIPLRSRRMMWNLVPRTGFEPAPPAWEAGMLTVDNTGTGGCGTVSTRHAPARDRACDGPHPSAFDGIRTRGLPLRRRAPYPLGHEGERAAPDPRGGLDPPAPLSCGMGPRTGSPAREPGTCTPGRSRTSTDGFGDRRPAVGPPAQARNRSQDQSRRCVGETIMFSRNRFRLGHGMP